MRRLVDKTVLAGLCLTLAVMDLHAVAVPFVAAMLAAVCGTTLFEWLRDPHRRAALAAGGLLAACVVPHLCWFLPLGAYDSMRLDRDGAARDGSGDPAPARTGRSAWAAARWLWLAPTAVTAACAAARRSPLAPSFLVALVLLTVVAALFGMSVRREDRLAHALPRIEDVARDVMRRQRSRIADGEEERAAAVRMATMAERTRIAREIHDNVGHLLTRAIMQTEAARVVADASGDEAGAARLAGIGATVDEAMTMVRRSVHDLEDAGTDVHAQIRAAASSFDAATAGFSVRLDDAIGQAPAPVARCLATVIREALSNVAHHSTADEVSVVLHDFPAFWQLVVQDNGGPAAGARTGAPRGMGLADIDARVRSLGGTATYGPYGAGWRVFASIPKAPWADTARKEQG